MDLLDRMLGYDRWMTAQYLELSRDLTDAQLDQEFDIGLRTLRETFHHMIYNVGAWTGYMLGEPVVIDHSDHSVPAFLERHEQTYESFARAAYQLRAEQRLDDIFLDHHDYPQSIGGTIVNVVHHNAHHRSEVRHILVRLGVPVRLDGDPQEWEHLTNALPALQAAKQG